MVVSQSIVAARPFEVEVITVMTGVDVMMDSHNGEAISGANQTIITGRL